MLSKSSVDPPRLFFSQKMLSIQQFSKLSIKTSQPLIQFIAANLKIILKLNNSFLLKCFLFYYQILKNSAMDVKSKSKSKSKYLKKTFVSFAFDNIDLIVRKLSHIEYQKKEGRPKAQLTLHDCFLVKKVETNIFDDFVRT